MNAIERLLGHDGQALADFRVESLVLALLMAFLIGQTIAWVYLWTHSGLSYARSFTQSLVLLTMVVSLVMFVIGDSIITAFGLIGALAIIRFRNVLKDTRDTTFVFFSLVLGMAVGSQRFTTALVGTVVLCAITVYLHISAFGSRNGHDGHLACHLAESRDEGRLLRDVLRRFCVRAREMSVRHLGEDDTVERVFEVRLRDRRRGHQLVAELQRLEGVGEVSLVLRDENLEV